MIKLIIELLQLDDHYGQSEIIEIAKGKYELNNTFSKGFKQIKRELKCLKQKQ
ncbi:hypothetical protein UFOVP309_52 [uncultured Caudovirales phage]|uniref:Uncharacterized protein n=1 Tax=uncultured Caudovirales phage TaxID=2100421 RepID=A0A6J5LQU2_9CAUD|nr:hypothetical protein UFOVP309_52 [uncultured Caudovirales phage]CAB4173411.1 hypothetical protein UFOVP946_59 [uncultured Caudovirales phage]